MLLACRQLDEGLRPVISVALSLGYASEASFTTAFTREIGCPPRRYQRRDAAPVAVRDDLPELG